MTKAFTKAEKIIRRSIDVCNSDDAWNGNSKSKFDRCTEKLKRSNAWIGEIYKHVEKLAAKEGNYILISDYLFMILKDLTNCYL